VILARTAGRKRLKISARSTVPKVSDRLACYDRVTPPTTANPVTAKQKAAVSRTSPDQGEVVDALAIEKCNTRHKVEKDLPRVLSNIVAGTKR